MWYQIRDHYVRSTFKKEATRMKFYMFTKILKVHEGITFYCFLPFILNIEHVGMSMKTKDILTN